MPPRPARQVGAAQRDGCSLGEGDARQVGACAVLVQGYRGLAEKEPPGSGLAPFVLLQPWTSIRRPAWGLPSLPVCVPSPGRTRQAARQHLLRAALRLADKSWKIICKPRSALPRPAPAPLLPALCSRRRGRRRGRPQPHDAADGCHPRCCATLGGAGKEGIRLPNAVRSLFWVCHAFCDAADAVRQKRCG